MRGSRGGAVIVGLLVRPVHAALIARLQTPAVVERTQPIHFEVQRLMVILRLAFAEIIVVGVGGNIAVFLFLVALTRHLAGAESGIEGQFLVLSVELLRIKEVERVVHVDIVAAGGLVVVQRVVVEVDVAGVDIAVTLTIAAAQLIGK